MPRSKSTKYGKVWWDYQHKGRGMQLGIEAERGRLEGSFICFIPQPRGEDDTRVREMAEDLIHALRKAGLADKEE